MHKSPSFIYRNRCGIFYFQRRIPEIFRKANPDLPRFFRKTLSTNNRTLALRLARKMAVEFDELAQQYFQTREGFAIGLKLYQQYKEAEVMYPKFEDFQSNFLDQIDDDGGDGQTKLLGNVFRYLKAKNPDQAVRQNQSNSSLIEGLVSALKTPVNSIPINKAIAEFLTEKKQNWKGENDSVLKYQDVFSLFEEVNGSINTGDLDLSHSNAYKNTVFKYPKNRKKMAEFRSLSLSQILELDIPTEKQLSPTTKDNYLSRIVVFLNWLEVNGYSSPNLSKPLQIKTINNVQSHEKKNPYTDNDLSKIFNSVDYNHGLHDSPFKFWVPLISLLSGARINEICQLLVEDVYKLDNTGIYVFDVNQNDSGNSRKSIKLPSHKRLVPIHKQLIEFGFIDYVEYMKSKNQNRIFPELPYCGIKNKFGGKASRWFNNTFTNKNNCDITTEKTSIHSLRHNISGYFSKTLNLTEPKYVYALGQAPVGGVSSKVYVTPEIVQELHKSFNKVDFSKSIDFSKIRNWKKHKFYNK